MEGSLTPYWWHSTASVELLCIGCLGLDFQDLWLHTRWLPGFGNKHDGPRGAQCILPNFMDGVPCWMLRAEESCEHSSPGKLLYCTIAMMCPSKESLPSSPRDCSTAYCRSQQGEARQKHWYKFSIPTVFFFKTNHWNYSLIKYPREYANSQPWRHVVDVNLKIETEEASQWVGSFEGILQALPETLHLSVPATGPERRGCSGRLQRMTEG